MENINLLLNSLENEEKITPKNINYYFMSMHVTSVCFPCILLTQLIIRIQTCTESYDMSILSRPALVCWINEMNAVVLSPGPRGLIPWLFQMFLWFQTPNLNEWVIYCWSRWWIINLKDLCLFGYKFCIWIYFLWSVWFLPRPPDPVLPVCSGGFILLNGWLFKCFGLILAN